jgi:hypothetical protein
MAEEYRPGQNVPTSGIYRVTHEPTHSAMPNEVTVLKGRQFPSCPQCKTITYELVHPAKHVREIPPLFEADDLKQVGTRHD